MALSDIAAGIEVTTEQRDRGVASVDRTDESLADRLAGAAEDLPCDAETAATLVETYAAGESVGDAGRAADVAPITAAKTLHHVGEHVSPLSPTARDVVGDWLDGTVSRGAKPSRSRVRANESSHWASTSRPTNPRPTPRPPQKGI